MTKTSPSTTKSPRHFAIVGAGISGITAARTLLQAGHRVTVFEKSAGAGGRMSTRSTEFGGFDHGAQYFTVRDARFTQALKYALAVRPGVCRPWSANAVRVHDAQGQVTAAALPGLEPHWVAQPGMNALVRLWAQGVPQLRTNTQVIRIQKLPAKGTKPAQWQVLTVAADSAVGQLAEQEVHGGFDAVLLALPAPQAHALLDDTAPDHAFTQAVSEVEIAPCWTLMLAFPKANQPGLSTFGPQWNAARSTHHRLAWLARESSKPQRSAIERWTVQAGAEWSREHVNDDAPRVTAKLVKAFSEVTGIRAQPAMAVAHRWMYAKTEKPLGKTHLWDAKLGLGLCGDWCTGHRVEEGFVSGLELALGALKSS